MFTQELRKSGKLPLLDSFVELRERPVTMKVFCDRFLPCVVGKVEWRKAMQRGASITASCTRTDEAFALLCIENIYDIWLTKPLDNYKYRQEQGVLKDNMDEKDNEEDAYYVEKEVGSEETGTGEDDEVGGSRPGDGGGKPKRTVWAGKYTKGYREASKHEGWNTEGKV